MIFKIYLNNQIKRLRGDVNDFEALLELVKKAFKGEIPQYFCVEYQDADGDKVRINCQEDFSILLEELNGAKSVKIFVKEDLNQSQANTVSTHVFESDPSIQVISDTKSEKSE